MYIFIFLYICADIKGISSINVLKNKIALNENSWLLWSKKDENNIIEYHKSLRLDSAINCYF